MTAILGLAPKQQQRSDPPPRLPTGPLIVYSRSDILKQCRRAVVPRGLGPLESWYGAPPKQHEDPAIASIAPAGRRGFGGEAFGMGVGRVRAGTRNIGLRRQPEDQEIRGNNFGGPMGKFAVRGEKPMRLGGDREEGQQRGDRRGEERGGGGGGDRGDRGGRRREEDWRRGERQAPPHQQRNGDRRYNNRYDDENAEPAWMNDDEGLSAPLEDPAIASASSGDPTDPLVKFIPGEDMIAAHKRAMKARQAGADGADTWRSPADKPLVSFFGGAAPPQPAAPAKPREVNLQSYFKHKVVDDDEPDRREEEVEEKVTVQSRFQRFFGNTGGPGSQSGAPAAPVASSPIAPVQERQYERQPERQYERQPEPQYERQYERQPERYEQPQQAPSHARSPIDQASPVQGGRVDDHMAKLMGLLTTKGPSPSPRAESASHFQGPPGISSYQQSPSVETGSDYMSSRSRQDHSPDRMMNPQHFSPPPPGVDPRAYAYGPGPGPPPGYRPSMGELPGQPRQFYDQRPVDRPPPDLLQLLQGGGGRPMPPPMGMLPPHPMYGGPPGPPPGPTPEDLLRNLHSSAGPTSPPGYLPMRPPNGFPPPMQGYLPPPPQGYYGPGPSPGPRMPPGMMYGGPGGGGPTPPGQQDMLAALLGPRS